MLWIDGHKNVWRVAVLLLLLVAMMGPWNFELINVPSEYSCSAPFVRLDEDFCGTPAPGIGILLGLVGQFIHASAELATGTMGLAEWARWAVFGLFLFPLLLPLFSTLLLSVSGDRRGRQAFNVAAWSLASGAVLLIGVSWRSRLFWAAWGFWLYIGVAASALILEVLTLAAGRRPRQE
jgi:hypothetical protein